jgi:threonine dehydrogenase-like Zn-dependent dehydrogenase
MPRGATVLVVGGGIMGLLTMVIARHRGAGRVILSDPIVERREVARRLGAEHVVDPARENLRDFVLGLTDGRGVDVGCEAVGKPSLVAETMTMVKPKGVMLLVGVSPKGQPLAVDLYDFHYRELSLHGAYGRGTSFRRALSLMPALDVGALVTARFPLERIEEAFAHAAAGRGVKTVLTPGTPGGGGPSS